MVDKSISLYKPLSGSFFITMHSRQAISTWKKAPSDAFCSRLPRPAHAMLLHPIWLESLSSGT
jgi:hypothetical protein